MLSSLFSFDDLFITQKNCRCTIQKDRHLAVIDLKNPISKHCSPCINPGKVENYLMQPLEWLEEVA